MDHQSLCPMVLCDMLHDSICNMQVISMFWHQDELHGVIEVLNTPAGRLVRGLYCQGLMFGASTRGYSGVFNPEAGQLYSVVGTDLVIFS